MKNMKIGRFFKLVYAFEDEKGAYAKEMESKRFIKILDLHAFETTKRVIYSLEGITGFKIELLDSCKHCKHYEKVPDHMYKYDGSLGAERFDDYCNKWDKAIGDSTRHPDIFEDVDAKTFTCGEWEDK